jgi:hypothetical protein
MTQITKTLTIIFLFFAIPCNAATLNRTIETGDNTIIVQINITPDTDTLAYNLEEKISSDIFTNEISNDGIFNPETNTIKWGTFLDNTKRTLTYTLQVDPGSYTFVGDISFNGRLEKLTGDQTAEIEYFPLNITLHKLPPTQVGKYYTIAITTSGGYLPYQFDIPFGELPPGLDLDSDKGIISGTPQISGSHFFSVSAADRKGNYAEREYNLEINKTFAFDEPVIIPRGTKGFSFTFNITATGGKADYQFTKVNGALPNGLTFQENGNLSGTPTEAGNFSFTVQVKDAYDRIIEKGFTIQVDENVAIAETTVPDGIVGNKYEKQLNASGGYGDFGWSIYSGVLPDGLMINPENGHISGTPEKACYNSIVIAVEDAENRIAYKDMIFEVVGELSIENTELPTGLTGSPYSEAIRFNGGKGPFEFDYTGELPLGLSLDKSSGIISGSPESGGYNNITIKITDSTQPDSQQISAELGIRTTGRLTITTPAILDHFRKGKEMNPFNLEAGGGPSPYQWSIIKGRLPFGLQMSSDNAEISGTPIESGDMIMTVEVRDQRDQTAQKEFFWHIYDTLSIQTKAIPDAAKDIVYNVTLKASGGLPDYTWGLISGQLPDGLQLDNKTGRIYGSPSKYNPVTFTIHVKDQDDPPQMAEHTFTIDVLKDDLYIYTPTLPHGRINQAYTSLIEAKLGTPPYEWRLLNDAIPDGLELISSQNSLRLSGTPTQVGEYIFMLYVTDAGNTSREVSKAFTIQVSDQVAILSTELPYASYNENYHASIQVTSGIPPYTWRIINGRLPNSLELNANTGHISGIIDPEADSQEFTISVEDSGEPESFDLQQYAIYVVNRGITIEPDTIQTAMQRKYYEVKLNAKGGVGPFHWTISNGTLPGWLRIDPERGIISGKPIQCGTFDFSVKVVDSGASISLGLMQYQLEILCDHSPVIAGDLNASGDIELSDLIVGLQILSGIHAVDYFLPEGVSVLRMDDLIHIFNALDVSNKWGNK